MITREFKLYLNAGVGVAPVINANQFDQDEEWIFTLLKSDGTVYTPSTGAIIGLKQDGTTILNAGTVNASGQVVITETEQMTAVPGSNLFEILIDGNTHGTANFVVFVERRPGDIDNPSESDISLFQEAIEAAGNVTQFQADISALQSGLATTNANLTSEANTRASADATLQTNLSAEASTRQTQDAVLQAEIDQIIAPTGEAPSAAEVQNARIGVNGTTYDTLGNAIRTQVSDLKNALNEAVILLTGERSNGGTSISFDFKQGVRYFLSNTGSSTFNAFLRVNGENVQTIQYNIPSNTTVEFTANQDADTLRLYMNGAGSFKLEYNLPKQNQEDIAKLFQLKSTDATDGNNIRETGYYVITASKTNVPESSGILIVYTGSDNHYQTYQIFISYSTETMYIRNEKGSGTWSDWMKVSSDWNKLTTTETDVNNIVKSGFYFVPYTDTNLPISDAGVLIVYRNDTNANYGTYQMFISYNTSHVYTRGKINGVWSNWINSSQHYGMTNIAWFGDSTSALRHLPRETAKLVSANYHSFAIPGAPFDKSSAGNWKYEYVGFANLMDCMFNNDYSEIDTAVAQFISDNPDWAYSSNMTDFKTLDWSAIDTVVVSYGTNDYSGGIVPIATFKSDIKNAFVKLMQKHPLVRIYVFTPPYRTDGNTDNPQGLKLSAYITAIMEVCNELNIPCYDTYHNSGINEYTASTYLDNDGLHPSASGNVLLSQKVGKYISSN